MEQEGSPRQEPAPEGCFPPALPTISNHQWMIDHLCLCLYEMRHDFHHPTRNDAGIALIRSYWKFRERNPVECVEYNAEDVRHLCKSVLDVPGLLPDGPMGWRSGAIDMAEGILEKLYPGDLEC